MWEIFPELALDASIHTSLLIGIVVLWFFTESMGWVFAGFVCAGYLATIAAVHPPALVATFLEAILTYGVTWAIGIGARHLRLWQQIFGRERFFLFLLVSIPVRAFVDANAGQELQQIFTHYLGIPALARGDFLSVGVILVPLTANAFWKVGLWRGLVQTSLVTAVTYAAVVGILVPYTNFHIASFALTFDDVALDFLATPGVHVVIIITAAIAARNSLRYGWNYNGIMVPALLALLTAEPLKLVATVAEIVLLVWAYRGIRKIPAVGLWNLEGPRGIVTMYLLSYTIKFVLGHLGEALGLRIHFSDFFGFGYMLTSLVALKCVQKRDIPRILVPTLVTAAQGAAVAAVVSMALGLISFHNPSIAAERLADSTARQRVDRSVLEMRASVRPVLAGAPLTDGGRRTGPLLRLIAEGRSIDLAPRGLDVNWSERGDGTRCLAVRSSRDSDDEVPTGSPPFLWCGGSGPVLVVPQPVGDPDALWIAAMLAERLPFSGVVISGIDGRPGDHVEGLLTREGRGYGLADLLNLLGDRSAIVLTTTTTETSTVQPRSSRSDMLLGELRALIPGLSISFVTGTGRMGEHWRALRDNDSLLRVSAADVEAALAASEPDASSVARPLDAVFASMHEALEARDPQVYDRGTVEERTAFAEILVERMLAWAAASAPDAPPPRGLIYLGHLMSVEVVSASARDSSAWLLHDPKRGWGGWLVRPGPEPNHLLLVPYAADEPGTLGVGHALFEHLEARALWWGEASSAVRWSGVGDAMEHLGGAGGAERMAVREALRPGARWSWADDLGVLVLRRRTPDHALPAPAVASTGGEVSSVDRERLAALLDKSLGSWAPLDYMDGRRATTRLSAASYFPLLYAEAMDTTRGAVLWLDANALQLAEGHPRRRAALQNLERLGITPMDAAGYVSLRLRLTRGTDLPPAVAHSLRYYWRTLEEGTLETLLEKSGAHLSVFTSPMDTLLVASAPEWTCWAWGTASVRSIGSPTTPGDASSAIACKAVARAQ